MSLAFRKPRIGAATKQNGVIWSPGLQYHVFRPLNQHKLSQTTQQDVCFVFQVRSEVIATYGLCGFANFGSLGLVIGGLSKNTSHRQFIWQANPKENTQMNRLWVKLSSLRGWAAALLRPSTQLCIGGLPEGRRLWCGGTGRGVEGKGRGPSPANRPPCPALIPRTWAVQPLGFRRSKPSL